MEGSQDSQIPDAKVITPQSIGYLCEYCSLSATYGFMQPGYRPAIKSYYGSQYECNLHVGNPLCLNSLISQIINSNAYEYNFFKNRNQMEAVRQIIIKYWHYLRLYKQLVCQDINNRRMKTPPRESIKSPADHYGFVRHTNTSPTQANKTIGIKQHRDLNNRNYDTPRTSQKIYTKDNTALKKSAARSDDHTVRSVESLNTTKFKERIEKACETMNNSDLRKEILILKKQIQKLEKETIRKDQQLKQMKATVMPTNQAQAELIEVYRSLHYYEGKTKQMEEQLYRFRELIANSSDGIITQQSLNLIFQDLRRDNQQLHAALQETEFMKRNIQIKYNKLQAKYFELHRQLTQIKRKQANPLAHLDPLLTQSLSTQHLNRTVNQLLAKNKSIPNSLNMQLKEKEVIFRMAENQLNKKLNQMREQLYQNRDNLQKIITQLEQVKAENELLRNEREEKDKQIQDLFKQYAATRKSLRELQSQKDLNLISRSQKVLTSVQKI